MGTCTSMILFFLTCFKIFLTKTSKNWKNKNRKLKRRPSDGKFPGRGCAQKPAPVKGLANAALHGALLMMRGGCKGTERTGKRPSSAPAPGLGALWEGLPSPHPWVSPGWWVWWNVPRSQSSLSLWWNPSESWKEEGEPWFPMRPGEAGTPGAPWAVRGTEQGRWLSFGPGHAHKCRNASRTGMLFRKSELCARTITHEDDDDRSHYK